MPSRPNTAKTRPGMRPKVFLGSSTEGQDLARALQQELDISFDSTVWTQGVFGPGSYTMEALVSAARTHDFAVFVLTPDDSRRSRSKQSLVARDNVLLEVGLFMGALGRERCFIVAPRDVQSFSLPTDLLGVTTSRYTHSEIEGNERQRLGAAATELLTAMRRLGARASEESSQAQANVLESYRQVDWKRTLSSATKSVDLVAYYFDSWVNSNFDALVRFFENPGAKLRLFQSDPHVPSNLDELRRLFPEYSADELTMKVLRTGSRIAEAAQLAQAQPTQLEVRFLQTRLSYSAQCVDKALLHVSVFEMFRKNRIDSPVTVFDLNKSAHLKRYWEKELSGLLHDSKQINVKRDP